MANPSVLSVETKLYSPAEPAGRIFPAGHEWPGDAWSTSRSGEQVSKNSTVQAMKDVKAAQKTIDGLSAQLEGATHSLALRSGERDEAVGKLAALEQRAISAETARAEADQAAASYMRERDAARADAKRLSDAVAGLRPDAERIPGLVAEIEAAHQRAADLQAALDAKPTPARRVAPKPKPKPTAKAKA